MLVVVIRIKIKALCIIRKSKTVEFTDIGAMIRTLERRLGQVTYSGDSAQVLDLFLTNPEGIERVISLSV